MTKLITTFLLSIFLVIPAYANDAWDDIKDAVEDDDRPGQHGRDNAENAKKGNPGKGSKKDDDSVWDKIGDEIDDDDKKGGKNKNKSKK